MLRGEADKLKFIDFRFGKIQVVEIWARTKTRCSIDCKLLE